MTQEQKRKPRKHQDQDMEKVVKDIPQTFPPRKMQITLLDWRNNIYETILCQLEA